MIQGFADDIVSVVHEKFPEALTDINEGVRQLVNWCKRENPSR